VEQRVQAHRLAVARQQLGVTALGSLLEVRQRRRCRLIVPGGRFGEQVQGIAAEGASEHGSAHGGVGEGVVLAIGVVDAVAAAACGATLKADELVEQAGVLGQRDAAGVEQRQRVAVNVGLGLLGSLVANAPLLERLGWKAATPSVAHNLADAVALEQWNKLVVDNLRRCERWAALAHAVDDHALALAVADRQRKGVAA